MLIGENVMGCMKKTGTPWIDAGVSRSSWYRYLSVYRDQVSENGISFLIEYLRDRVLIKKSLSSANQKLLNARKAIRMRVER